MDIRWDQQYFLVLKVPIVNLSAIIVLINLERKAIAKQSIDRNQGPLSLTLFNFNPSLDQ